MTPVIHCSTGNISLFPIGSFRPSIETQLGRISCSERYPRVATSSSRRRLLLPRPAIRLIGINRRCWISRLQRRTRAVSAVGSDVAVEEPSPAPSGEPANEKSESTAASAEASEPAKAERAQTASSAKLGRTIHKSVMPPVKDEELVRGASFTGKVRSIRPFGIFVDLGAFTEGLVHISKASDGYIKDINSLFTVGQEVTVRIVEANKETNRISLTMRTADDYIKPKREPAKMASDERNRTASNAKSRPSPVTKKREETKSKFVEGQALTGTVKTIAKSGAFISLPEGEQGFLPRNEEPTESFVALGRSSLEEGQEVNVRVLRISRGQATLTMKQEREDDVGVLNKKLEVRGPNAFHFAFRMNKEMAAFLDERQKGKPLETQVAGGVVVDSETDAKVSSVQLEDKDSEANSVASFDVDSGGSTTTAEEANEETAIYNKLDEPSATGSVTKVVGKEEHSPLTQAAAVVEESAPKDEEVDKGLSAASSSSVISDTPSSNDISETSTSIDTVSESAYAVVEDATTDSATVDAQDPLGDAASAAVVQEGAPKDEEVDKGLSAASSSSVISDTLASNDISETSASIGTVRESADASVEDATIGSATVDAQDPLGDAASAAVVQEGAPKDEEVDKGLSAASSSSVISDTPASNDIIETSTSVGTVRESADPSVEDATTGRATVDAQDPLGDAASAAVVQEGAPKDEEVDKGLSAAFSSSVITDTPASNDISETSASIGTVRESAEASVEDATTDNLTVDSQNPLGDTASAAVVEEGAPKDEEVDKGSSAASLSSVISDTPASNDISETSASIDTMRGSADASVEDATADSATVDAQDPLGDTAPANVLSKKDESPELQSTASVAEAAREGKGTADSTAVADSMDNHTIESDAPLLGGTEVSSNGAPDVTSAAAVPETADKNVEPEEPSAVQEVPGTNEAKEADVATVCVASSQPEDISDDGTAEKEVALKGANDVQVVAAGADQGRASEDASLEDTTTGSAIVNTQDPIADSTSTAVLNEEDGSPKLQSAASVDGAEQEDKATEGSITATDSLDNQISESDAPLSEGAEVSLNGVADGLTAAAVSESEHKSAQLEEPAAVEEVPVTNKAKEADTVITDVATTHSADEATNDSLENEPALSAEKEAALNGANDAEVVAAGADQGSTTKATLSPALVKQLREETGAGMMDCKKALVESGGDLVKAQEFLRKKGLASADKKAGRAIAEGRIGSYIHDNRIGVLLEVNCETDFVSRGDIFKELVDDLAMQVAACPQVKYLSTDDIPEEIVNKEKELEMQKEDLLSKPEQIRPKIVEGRVKKRLEEFALLEQPFIKNDKITIKDWVKQTIATIGENMKVKRFVRYNLGEGLEKKSQDFAAEVAAQTAARPPPAIQEDDKPAETPEIVEKKPIVAVSAALVKQLREETGAGMMDCKKALSETGGDLERAQAYLRKKGLSSAAKKSSRLAAEGLISSYIHDSRIGCLIEVNSETDFVARNEKFRELVNDLAMQVVACPQVEYVSVEDIPGSVISKEKEIEMQREDLQSKPENIREKIIEGRIAKRLGVLALLEQPFIKDDTKAVKDLVKETIAALGENIKVRRFVRYTLGEN